MLWRDCHRESGNGSECALKKVWQTVGGSCTQVAQPGGRLAEWLATEDLALPLGYLGRHHNPSPRTLGQPNTVPRRWFPGPMRSDVPNHRPRC